MAPQPSSGWHRLPQLTRVGACAGGSAKQARDRHFQAILPLRGKILNVERRDDADIYKNTEIASLIVALGLGVKGNDKLSGLRYGKVGCPGVSGSMETSLVHANLGLMVAWFGARL